MGEGLPSVGGLCYHVKGLLRRRGCRAGLSRRTHSRLFCGERERESERESYFGKNESVTNSYTTLRCFPSSVTRLDRRSFRLSPAASDIAIKGFAPFWEATHERLGDDERSNASFGGTTSSLSLASASSSCTVSRASCHGGRRREERRERREREGREGKREERAGRGNGAG